MQTHPHGGWCCGVTHLRGFGDPEEKAIKHTQVVRRGRRLTRIDGRYKYVDDPSKDFVDWKEEDCNETNEEVFDSAVAKHKSKNTGGGILEVILTDNYLGYNEYGKFWATKLKEAGFKLVSRFLNNNSGNVCNVFHLYKEKVPEGLPPNWE